MEPRFKHDCEACTFLGTHDEFDLYFCPQFRFPTIVGRFGDEGGEYNSGYPSLLPELQEGARRAFERGLLEWN